VPPLANKIKQNFVLVLMSATKFHKILFIETCKNTMKTERKNNKIPQNFVHRTMRELEEN